VVLGFFSLVVSSTAAYIMGDSGSFESNFISIQDFNATIYNLETRYPVGQPDDIEISFKIFSSSGVYPDSEIMVQLVDEDGELLVTGPDPTSDYLHAVTTATISPIEQTITVTIVDDYYPESLSQLVDGFVISVTSSHLEYDLRLEKTQSDEIQAKGSFIIYRSAADTTVPRYRYWGDGIWGVENDLNPQANSMRTVRAEFSSKPSESENAISAVMAENGDLNVYHNTQGSWTGPIPIDTIPSGSNTRTYDLAYEYTSGEGILVYAKNTRRKKLYVKLFTGGGWVSGPALNIHTSSRKIGFVRLAAKQAPGSNEVAVVYVDTSKKVYAAVWDGDTNTWSTPYPINGGAKNTASTYKYEPADLVYTYDSGDLILAVGSGKGVYVYRKTGSTWAPDTGWGPGGYNTMATGGNIRYIMLRAHLAPGSDNVAMVAFTDLSDLWLTAYTYNSILDQYFWQNSFLVDDTMESPAYRCFDGDWAPTGTRFWLFGGEFAEDSISYKVYSVMVNGVFYELSPLGMGVWHKYDYDPSTANQYQKWVQVKVAPYAGEPNFFVNILNDDEDIYSIAVPSVTDITDTSGYSTTYISNTGTINYECFNVAWIKFPPS